MGRFFESDRQLADVVRDHCNNAATEITRREHTLAGIEVTYMVAVQSPRKEYWVMDRVKSTQRAARRLKARWRTFPNWEACFIRAGPETFPASP